MTEEERYHNNEGEADLFDYFKVVARRKWLIFSATLLAVIIAAVFSFLAPKVYKVDIAIEIGTLSSVDGKEDMLEDPIQVVEKLKGDAYGILVRKNLNIPEDKYPKKNVENPKGTRLIKISINSIDPGQAKVILEELDKLIIAEHNQKVRVQSDLIGKNIKTIEEKIKLAQSDIVKTTNKIGPMDLDIMRIENKIKFAGEEKQNLEAKVEALQKVFVYQQDPGTQFALFDTKEKLAGKKQEIESLYLEINNLRSGKEDLGVQINSMKSSIESFNSGIDSLRASLDHIRPTQAIKEPTISEEPVSPRLILNVVIAGILGLFSGTFLTFFQEWYLKNKSRL